MEDLGKDIELFVRNYVSALENLVKENNQQIKSINLRSGFPTEFPVRATVFLSSRGIILNYEKADLFEVSVVKNERPPVRAKWSEFIPYYILEKIKDKASEKANTDVEYFLNLPRMIEEHEQEMERQYEAQDREYWTEEINYTTEHYVEFLGKAKEVVDETRKEATQEVYDMVKVIQNHLSNYEFVIRARCIALARLHFMINSDMETSLFLALNGKYLAATALLRKILEVNVRSIYLDSLPDRAKAERATDDWIMDKMDKKKFPVKRKFSEIVDALLGEEIDKALSGLLRKQATVESDSVKQSILSLYKDLNVFVHLKPKKHWEEDLRFSFSEFKIGIFRSYCTLFKEVAKISEILLVLKFPKVVSTPRIGRTEERYTGLILSEHELDGIVKL